MKAKDVVITKIIEKMKEGIIPWQNPYLGGGLHRNFVSGKPYKGINVLTTWLSGYSKPFWVSFKQAKALGGHVKKGERGTPILFFTIVEDKRDPDKTFPVFKYTSMFNVDQCEFPFEIETENKKIGDPIEACEQIIRNCKVNIDIGDRPYGSYDKITDTIKMPEMKRFTSVEEYYSTFFHEMIHSTGSRLNRDTEDRAVEELTAEIGSALLCNEAGAGFVPNTEVFENQVAYIQGWMKQISDAPKMLYVAASDASKAVEYILQEAQAVAA